MKLTFYRGAEPNFGDELNAFIWPRLLEPGFLDEREDTLFIGIGSILWDSYPREALKLVVGSGYGGYTPMPDVHDGSWRFAFVRGPLTAQKLGLPEKTAISDGAVLLRAVDLPAPIPHGEVAFIPHFESMHRGNWPAVCEAAGLRMIDPRAPVEQVIAEIRGARLVITEAMHGAIVADALRVPWISVLPVDAKHHFKWTDWAASLGLVLAPVPLPVSSLQEAWVRCKLGEGKGRFTASLRKLPLAGMVERRMVEHAAGLLRRVMGSEPQLSRDSAISGVTDRALSALDAVRRGQLAAAG